MGDIAVYNGTQAGLAGPHLRYFICWKSICTPLAFSKPITIYPRRQQRFEEAQERPPRWWQLEHSPSEEREVGGTSLVQPGWIQVNLTEAPVPIGKPLRKQAFYGGA